MKKEEIIAEYGGAAYEEQLEQSRAWQEAHKEEKREANTRYYKENREHVVAIQKKYREEHQGKVNARVKKWCDSHPEEVKAHRKKYRDRHPETMAANAHERCRKGGRRYDKNMVYKQTGIQGEKNKIRNNHARQYKPYKNIIAPDSQLHHEWIPDTSDYRGVALVEKDPHQYGIIDVILILDGGMTLLTEEEVKRGGMK